MKALHFLLFTIALVTANTQASETKWSLESDPIAFAMQGFSLHGLYEIDAWRFDLGVFGLTLPESMLPETEQKMSFQGMGLKVDHFFTTGWFAGIQSSINQIESQPINTNATRKNLAYETSIRTGYRWFASDHFYIQPWISLGYQDFLSKENAPELSKVALFPTVHLGWSF